MTDTQKKLALISAIFGVLSAGAVLVVRWYEIRKARAEALQAEVVAGGNTNTAPQNKTDTVANGQPRGSHFRKWADPASGASLELFPSGKAVAEYKGSNRVYTATSSAPDEKVFKTADGNTIEIISVTDDQLCVHANIRRTIGPDVDGAIRYVPAEKYKAPMFPGCCCCCSFFSLTLMPFGLAFVAFRYTQRSI